MSCCGSFGRGTSRPNLDANEVRFPRVALTYTGTTTLTAIGGATGHCYRFGHQGATLPVHPRDAPGLLAISTLRRAGVAAGHMVEGDGDGHAARA